MKLTNTLVLPFSATGVCHVRLYAGGLQRPVAVVSQLSDGARGPRVQDCCEEIAALVQQRMLPSGRRFHYVELDASDGAPATVHALGFRHRRRGRRSWLFDRPARARTALPAVLPGVTVEPPALHRGAERRAQRPVLLDFFEYARSLDQLRPAA